ncbi:MAG: SoxR reducing system RseC family protein [Clostridia bacterium]|nr:SoxR reducing system RseC family protein [Clostridia bacterium]
MKTLATVVELEQENIATVSVARHAACDGCHKNADGTGCSVCTLLGGNREARAKALNTAGAAVGDTVEVESRTGRMLAYAALLFLLPVLLALGSYFLTLHLSHREGLALGMAALALVLTLACIGLVSHFLIGKRIDVEIVAIVKPQAPQS